MNDKPDGVVLPSRVVPFPASISDEARAALQRLVGDDGVPLNALHVMPAPDDVDAWMRVKAAADAHYTAAVGQLAGHLRSNVETIRAGDADLHVATPEAAASDECAYIDLHGGGLIVGGGAACRAGAQMQADRLGVRCYGVDYRMPPEHPYPAALDDCIAAYALVLGRHAPENIVIGGRSAGGNLAAAMVLRARDEGLPLPAALVLLSPEADLTESGDSFETNRLVDVVLPASLMPNNLLYANGADLAHPYLSPLFGEFLGRFPADVHPERYARPVPVERGSPASRVAARASADRTARVRRHAARRVHGRAGGCRTRPGDRTLRACPFPGLELSRR